MKIRNSNFELIRIISMFAIVLGHFLIHGNISNHAVGHSKILFEIIQAIIIVYVNAFILITGYFQWNKKVKVKKIIQLNNTIYFYTVVVLLFLLIFTSTKIPNFLIIRSFIPIPFSETYWFTTTYFILYLISPLLNIIIQKLNKDELKKTCILLFILFSVLPGLTHDAFYFVNRGYSLYNFVLLYFIGAYLSKYPVQVSQKKLLFTFTFCVILNVCFYQFAKIGINSYSGTIREIASIFYSNFTGYSNPLIILQSMSFFLIFANLNFKSKIINAISPAMFGVYLIHDNPYFRSWIYPKLGFIPEPYTWRILPKLILCTTCLFIVCVTIEKTRLYIFKKLGETKLAKELRHWYENKFKQLNIPLEW